jgi:CheY-like chemotaxis protein
MNRCDKLSILIIDDQWDMLNVFEMVLVGQYGHHVECVQMPGEAIRHVAQRLFDVVIIDAKMTYRGAPLGGLLLADEISRTLGIGSVLLMSQYDVREEVRFFNPKTTFLSKPRDGVKIESWVTCDLMNKIRALVEQQYGFVAMPFGDAVSTDWYKASLAPWMDDLGFKIKRMDEIATTRSINHELLARIREAHFIIFYASQPNLNAYFEAGYACACDKYVVILTPDLASLPFDLRSNYAIEVDMAFPTKTRAQLAALISGLRGITDS